MELIEAPDLLPFTTLVSGVVERCGRVFGDRDATVADGAFPAAGFREGVDHAITGAAGSGCQ